ncbi:MAG TPA: tetratricopeptide repeat protein [Flavisolibacter sp.]|jgi:tetratricopeptide (TPR) repeat protein|nr:tetratricopeptide repeat protein [Flavisolibacter sp.]
MKQKLMIAFLFASITQAQAQSIEQGKKQLYYERYNSAEQTFHTVLSRQPENAEAWWGLTEAYILQDQVSKASDTLLHAPAAVQHEPWFKVAQGTLLLQQNKAQAAAPYFDQAIEDTKGKDAALLAAVADAHTQAEAGNANEAITLLNRALQRDRKNPALYVALGDAYRKALNSSEAYKAYQQALAADGNYAAANHRMGEIFLTQKNPSLYLDYFRKAAASDPDYAPSLYKLYAYEFYHDPAKAMAYYKDYAAKSDHTLQHEYDLVDLMYLTKQYDQAIQKANTLLQNQGAEAKPRLYKLIGYSYAEKKDTASAIAQMQQYFAKEADSNLIAKDYIIMGSFYESLPGQDSLAAVYLTKGVKLETDSAALYGYYKKLADLAKDRKDYAAQASWLGKYYAGNEKATNLDLFNWGLAHYRAEEYVQADTVFGTYIHKYPDQAFGYYWQAKSKALADKDMEAGLAVPAYQKLIEVLQKDTADANYKKWMVEAYGYLAAYEVNTQKDYAEAVDYFEKVLAIDPENESAKKYIGILEKDIAEKGSK